MNIGGMISDFKSKIRERQSRSSQRQAESLAELRRERIRLEGQNKIYKTVEKEKARIAKAKSDVRKARFKNSILGKSVAVAKDARKFVRENRPDGGNAEKLFGKPKNPFK